MVTSRSAFFVVLVIAASLTLGASRSDAQGDDTDPALIALARALDAHLTVWRTPSGGSIHVRHCRGVKGGCRARVAAFARAIFEAARADGLDPFLLAAMAIRESGLDPSAEGAAGERGIVQLHPRGVGHHVKFVRSDAYRARCLTRADACQREVLEAGAEHAAAAIARCGSVAAGLGAYNSGTCSENAYARRILAVRATLIELARKTDGNPLLD